MTNDERHPAVTPPESPALATVPIDLAVTTTPLKNVDRAAPEPAGDIRRRKWDLSVRVDADLVIVDVMPSQADAAELHTHQLVLEVGQFRSALQRVLADLEPNDVKPRVDARRKPTRASAAWGADEDGKLAELYAAGWSPADLARHLKRSQGAIDSRLIRLRERGTISSDPGVNRGERSRPGRQPGAALSAAASDHSLTPNLLAGSDRPRPTTDVPDLSRGKVWEPDRASTGAAVSAERPNVMKTDTSIPQRRGPFPNHTRWSREGGKEIYAGGHPRPGEVVVTGQGKASHRSLECPALLAGRQHAMSRGWKSSGFYSVPVSLADRYVPRCSACWTGDDGQ